MFKLVVLSTLLAVAIAAPSGLHLEGPVAYSGPLLTKTILAEQPLIKTAIISQPSHVEISEPVVAKVGDIVQSVPTAVSHQSSTVVHNRANIVTPIVAPAVKTITAPVLRTVAGPALVSGHTLVSGPLVKTIQGPLTLTGPTLSYAAAAPVYKSYGYGAPLAWSGSYAHDW